VHLKSGVLPIIAGRLLSHEGPDCGDGGAVSGGGTHLDGLRRTSAKELVEAAPGVMGTLSLFWGVG
jgi:hypothetical protein